MSADNTSDQSKSEQSYLLSQVKNHIGGIGAWLTTNIPKLYVSDSSDNETNAPVSSQLSRNLQGSGDSMSSDANEGSRQAAIEGATTMHHLVGIQNTAKSLGNYLYTTVSEVGDKIKKTIEKNAYVVEFNKEQEVFIKDRANNSPSVGLAPWVGSPNEAQLKEACLCLSGDRRNFFRPPPAGIDFQFDYEVSYPTALAIMEQDPRLQSIRYELVPIVVSEENFWRNYFYRVSLVCQANELSCVSQENEEKDVGEGATASVEFVSDSFQESVEDVSGVEWDLENLTVKDEEWERELEEELQDYSTENGEIESVQEELHGALKEE